jgi:outer membrane protein assembly factor BamB
MALKGNLASMRLADVFQALSQGGSTGLLRVQAPEGPRFVEIQNGIISIAGRSGGRILLGDLLIARGLIDEVALNEGLRLQKETGKLLGQVLIEAGLLTLQQLEDALRFQIEEEVCELFMLSKGDFDFIEGAGLDARIAPAGGMVRVKLDLNTLLAEAAQRGEEWKALEQRIPSQGCLFQLMPDGRQALASSEGLSPEGLMLLRLIQAKRTVEAMVQKGCLGRFNTNRMLAELWDAGIIQPLPSSEYLAAAREHLGGARLEEAQRIAEFAASVGAPTQKEEARHLLEEIAKQRRPKPSTASVGVSADPKVRSEVIRRAQGNLMLKKESRSWGWIALIALVVLGGGGAGGYFYFGSQGSRAEYSRSRRELDEVGGRAQALIAEEKYAEALQLLRDFKTLDPDVRKQWNETFERRQQDVENRLTRAIERFTAARRSAAPEELEAAVLGLRKIVDIGVSSPDIAIARDKARTELLAYLDSQRAAIMGAKVEALERSAGKDAAAVLKEYEALLAEDPPETVAVKVREQVGRRRAQAAESVRANSHARTLLAAGDMEGARAAFDKVKQVAPGTALAADAEKEAAALGEAIAAAQADYEKIETMLVQNKPAEAREAIVKFLAGKPDLLLMARAAARLQTLEKTDETALAADLKAAAALYEKQPADPAAARTRVLELAKASPLAKASWAARLRVEISTQPEGAAVMVNGHEAGVTPLKAEIPALGQAHVLISLAGFRIEELAGDAARQDRITVPLQRLPQASSLVPLPAAGGIRVSGDQVVLAGRVPGSKQAELVLCGAQRCQVTRRIRLREMAGGDATWPAPAPAVLGGEAFVPTGGPLVMRVNLETGASLNLLLSSPAASSPAFFATVNRNEQRTEYMAVATQSGYECHPLEGIGAPVRLALGAAEQGGEGNGKALGAAFDGDLLFTNRSDLNVYAVVARAAARKWQASIGAEMRGAPALFPFSPPAAADAPAPAASAAVAVANAAGTIVALDSKKGEVLWRAESASAVDFGPASAGAGFLVLRREGKAELLAMDNKGAAAWSTPLPGKPILPACVVWDQQTPKGKAAAVCCECAPGAGSASAPRLDDGASCVLVLLAADTGKLLWRTELPAPAVAMAADGQRLHVSTADAQLFVFDVK